MYPLGVLLDTFGGVPVASWRVLRFALRFIDSGGAGMGARGVCRVLRVWGMAIALGEARAWLIKLAHMRSAVVGRTALEARLMPSARVVLDSAAPPKGEDVLQPHTSRCISALGGALLGDWQVVIHRLKAGTAAGVNFLSVCGSATVMRGFTTVAPRVAVKSVLHKGTGDALGA